MAVVRSWTPTLVVGGEAERVPAMRVSWNYFDMLGVRPALGRGFRPQEDNGEQWRVLLQSATACGDAGSAPSPRRSSAGRCG